MPDRDATLSATCPKPECGQEVEIHQRWTAGGVNDYGGYVLQCKKCGTVYPLHLGRDILDSRVRSGANVLDTYDDEIEGNREEVLKRHGLSPESAA
jgi:uncharacterized Zn finger protein